MRKVLLLLTALSVLFISCQGVSKDEIPMSINQENEVVEEVDFFDKVHMISVDFSDGRIIEIELNISEKTNWNKIIKKELYTDLESCVGILQEITDLSIDSIENLYDDDEIQNLYNLIVDFGTENELIDLETLELEKNKDLIKEDYFINFDVTDEIPFAYELTFHKNVDKNKPITIYLNSQPESYLVTELGEYAAADLNLIELTIDFRVPRVLSKYEKPELTSGSLLTSYLYLKNPPSFIGKIEQKYMQPHLIIEKIIDSSVEYLKNEGFSTDKRVISSGYQSGGVFTQRFAILSPEYVKAVIVGQAGGIFQLPFEKVGDHVLNHPHGINDYSEWYVGGREWNAEAYKDIYQLVYVATSDNTAIMVSDTFFKDSDFSFLVNNFGFFPSNSLYNQTKLLNEHGFEKIYFHIFEGIKQPTTSDVCFERCSIDIANAFFEAVLDGTIEERKDIFITPYDKAQEYMKYSTADRLVEWDKHYYEHQLLKFVK